MYRTWTCFVAMALGGLLLAHVVASAQEAAEETDLADWMALFDGESLDGWIQRGGKAKYEVVDRTIVGTAVPNTPNSFLCTEKDFADFELEYEFIVDPQLNSGVQIRSLSLPEYRRGRVHGYQVEIDPTDRAYTGGIYDEARRGWLYKLDKNEAARKAFRQGEWNHVRVVAQGNSIKTWLNGVPAADLEDDMTSEGFIALQVHSVGSRTDPWQIRWRNIRLRVLSGQDAVAPPATEAVKEAPAQP